MSLCNVSESVNEKKCMYIYGAQMTVDCSIRQLLINHLSLQLLLNMLLCLLGPSLVVSRLTVSENENDDRLCRDPI